MNKLFESDERTENDYIFLDRIVLRIRNQALQEKLLHMNNFDLKKAIEVYRCNEIANSQVRDVQGSAISTVLTENINKLHAHKLKQRTME